jgi:hypothetical protein
MSSGEQNTIPVPRSRVLVLDDGAFVVQWELTRVQDLLTGKYRVFADEETGEAISDYELNQLKNKGVIARYDTDLIHLCPTPDIFFHSSTRSYYLNTALPRTQKNEVESQLQAAELDSKLSVRVQERFVIIRGINGMPFPGFDEAEKARELLMARAPEFFKTTIVAFVEVIPAT